MSGRGGMSISERFAEIRAHFSRDAGRKLSQREMAGRFGVAKNSWQRYEAGELPGGGLLLKLADAGINIHWVLTGGGEMIFREMSPRRSDAAAILAKGQAFMDWLDAYDRGAASAYDLLTILKGGPLGETSFRDIFVAWFEAREEFTADEWLILLVFVPRLIALNPTKRSEGQ